MTATTKTHIVNLKGGKGDKGDQGIQGLNGVNAVPAVEAVASYVDGDTEARAAVIAAAATAVAKAGALGWQARNASGLPALDVTAATDRTTSAAAELTRYGAGSSISQPDFSSIAGWTAVPGTAAMSFTGGVFKSNWASGGGTPSLDRVITVLRAATLRVVARITVPATAPATNSALYALLTVSHKTVMNTANYTDRLGVGVNELNQPVIFSTLGMASTDAVQGAALPAGTYTATIVADEDRLSLTLTADDGSVEYRRQVLRDTLTDGVVTPGTVQWVSLINRDSRKATGVSINSVFAKTNATRVSAEAGAGKREHVWTTAASDALRVDVPPQYDPRAAAPIVLYCHGSGRDASDIGNANTAAMVRALTAAGYVTVVPSMGGTDPWGNPASVASLLSAYQYVRDHYAMGPILLVGASAGVLTALTALRQRNLPGVVGLYAMYGATNLRYQYDNNPTHTASIEAAFGFSGSANFDAATAGSDPQQGPGWIYRGIPMRFTASMADTTVDATNNTLLFAAKAEPYGPEASVLIGSGAHGDPSLTVTADALAFFDRCLNR